MSPDPLVEIYDVKVDLCGKAYGNIHGKILFDCTTYDTYIFDHDKESAIMIHKKVTYRYYTTNLYPPITYPFSHSLPQHLFLLGFLAV